MKNIFFRIFYDSFHALIVVIILFPNFYYFNHTEMTLDTARRFLLNPMVIIPFYLVNIYVFIPYLLKKRKYGYYLGAILGSFLLYFVVTEEPDLRNLRHMENGNLEFGPMPPPNFDTTRMNIRRLPPDFRDRPRHDGPRVPIRLFPLLILFGLGTSLEMIIDWERQKRLQEESKKEKLSAELSFLKSQINPHFLFNTLNNIYALATEKSEKTEDAILLLSDMMRYILYETNEDKVSLQQEITFIKNFIALQKIRLSEKKSIEIHFEVDKDIQDVMIEPNLFIPFVENAFKHGISYIEKSFVKIYLKTSKDTLYFSIANSYFNRNSEQKASGVGLNNIKQRLKILYPETHELLITQNESTFFVQLSIKIT